MRLTTAAVLVAFGLAAAGCGGGGTGTTTAGAETATTAATGSAAAGRAVFLGASGCGGCHTLADAGTRSSVASNLDEVRPSEPRVREFVTNGKDMMPAYRKQLTEQEITDVAAYVASVAGR